MAQLFGWFFDMSRGRSESLSGVGRITWETIHFWRRERRMRRLIDFEIDCFFALDETFRTVVAEKQKKPGEGGA